MTKLKLLKKGYTQICIYYGRVVGLDQVDRFEEFILESADTRAQYLDEVVTTGGRNDIVFAIHSADISKFAIARLKLMEMGASIKWLEDVIDHEADTGKRIYPDWVYQLDTRMTDSPVDESVKCPGVVVQLTGEDGNAFAILGKVTRAMKRGGFPELVNEYTTKAMSGTYDDLLRVTMEYVTVE